MASSSRPKSAPRSDKSSGTRSPESFQSLHHRNSAAEILQSYEKLSWYSMQRCESLTQTRIHFQNIIAGFNEHDEAELVDWREDLTPQGEVVKKEKGKERVSDVGLSSGAGVASASASGSGSGSVKKKKKKKRKSDGRVVC